MTVFISRTLAPDSPLRQWAAATGATPIDRSLLAFTPVPFTAPIETDWWFFYSARAVAYGAPQLPSEGVRTAAIGGSTAAALLDQGLPVDFCGDGDPERTAADFLAVGEGSRVFFPRARHSQKSIQTALAERVTALDAVCYDNRPVPPTQAIAADIYVFTSPLNVAAYLDRFTLPPGVRVLAMGPSTGRELERRGVGGVVWPRVAGEAGLVELLG